MLKENFTAKEILKTSPIIAVISIEKLEDALPLAYALNKGGVNVLEITLRTKVALKAIEVISTNFKEVIVGAGTVLCEEDLENIIDAGAKFAISPGSTPSLLKKAKELDFPLIPGVATASEIMNAMEFGYKEFKLFPAISTGGIDTLKSFGGPFKDISFCPTGGINEENFTKFLELKNVLCVGGSWVADKKLIKEKNFVKITEIAKRSLSKLL